MANLEEFMENLKEKVNSREYDDNSISKLEGEERVRTRPEALLGSNGIEGAQHTVVEIVGNSTDEKLSGYGDKLIITLHEDGAISVRDFGRGVPMGWNEEAKEWNYYLIYEELYAGGKYGDSYKQAILKDVDENDAWAAFNLLDFKGMVSIGLNGLGAAATQYSSEYCEVSSFRDGKKSFMRYEKGKHVLDELLVEDTTEPNGTLVKWKPDSEVFRDVDIKPKWLKKLCRQVSFVSGFKVEFYNKGVLEETWESKTLEEEMLSSLDGCEVETGFHHTRDEAGDVCVCQCEVAVGPGGKGSEYFHNRVEVKGGAHAWAYSSALADFFKDVASSYHVKVKEIDYSGKFSVIVSSLSNKMSLRGQTKDSVEDTFICTCIYNAILGALKKAYEKSDEWITNAVNETVENARNRMVIQEMSKNVKELTSSINKHKPSNKFVSCVTYEKGKANETDMYIVEGDSAGGRVATARDSYFQCYLAIRGKSLNVYKASKDKLIANKEIKDMIAALGCGVDLGIEGYETFNINKLKVNRVIFLADADIDGKHIRALLFLIFYKLFPELLYQGKVYVAETPLYVINLKNDTSVYCMSEEELAEQKEKIGQGNIYSVDRFKGLGETEAKTLWDTTLNPEKQILRQLKIDREDMDMTDVLEVLFGKSTERRKRAILGSMMDDFDAVIEEIENLADYVDSLNLGNLEVEEVEYSA